MHVTGACGGPTRKEGCAIHAHHLQAQHLVRVIQLTSAPTACAQQPASHSITSKPKDCQNLLTISVGNQL